MNYFEHLDGANCVTDLDDFLINLDAISTEEIKIIILEWNPIKINLPTKTTNDYKSLDLPEQNALTSTCGYLIQWYLKTL